MRVHVGVAQYTDCDFRSGRGTVVGEPAAVCASREDIKPPSMFLLVAEGSG